MNAQTKVQTREEIGLQESGLQESGLPREVYALLAQANLQRMRGRWEDAAQNCMAALRLAPDSSSAQSLLGDIYENQGRYDDAMQWYRMALDANPDSPADRLKLDRLLRRDQALDQVSAMSRPASAPFSDRSSSAFRHLFPDPETALRYTAILAALAVLLLIGGAYAVVRHGSGLKAIGLNSDQEVHSAPVLVPPVAGTIPSDPDALTVRDSNEQSLLTALQNSHDLSSQGILVNDVQMDPRTQQMEVTFSVTAASGLTRAVILRNALRTLEVASGAAGQSSGVFTARCLLVTTGAGTSPTASLAFVGDIPRGALPSAYSPRGSLADTNLTDGQVQNLFSNVWWSATADVRA